MGQGKLSKNIANIITCTRILLAIAFAFMPAMSWVFWVCYLLCGLSDVADGFVARKLNQVSKLGAKLDSIADLIFMGAIFIVFIGNMEMNGLQWIMIGAIALIKMITYGIGFFKFHKFAALHTYANKVVGVLIFLIPMTYFCLHQALMVLIICVAAMVACAEELTLIICMQELDEDCKGLWFVSKK